MTPMATPGRVPPGPPRSATFSLLRQLIGDRLTLMSTAASSYGDAVRVAIGPKTLYFFNHPDHAKHILADNAGNYVKGIGYVEARRALGDGLLTSDGELWKEQRRTIRPVFQHKRIAGQADTIIEEAGKLVARMKAAGSGGEVLDVLGSLTEFTLGVLGRTLLDADLGAFESAGHSFEAVQDQAMFEMETMGLVPKWLPLPGQRRFRKAKADLDTIVTRLVEHRKANPVSPPDDLISRLIESTAREKDPGVGAQRMRDELITLLLAGHETTASTVGWTMWLVSKHPDVAARLHDEAVAVLGDRTPVYEDLRNLRYTSMVIEEAMRLYPPDWTLTRKAVDADEVGGYHVPAGSDVMVCPYTLHRHPAYWPEPDRFDPERFDPAKPNDRPRYAYIPFGAGPRFCVGNHLGMMEAGFVLSMIYRELRMEAVPGHVPTPEPMLSLRMGGGLPMTARPA